MSYVYPDGTRALDEICMEVGPAERVAILGPNGAGKSTLLLHLNGVLLAQSGSVAVDGKLITPTTEHWAKSQVGLVFQDPDDQVFAPTVQEDVAFGPQQMGLPRPEVARRVRQALETVSMWEQRDRGPQHLSFGERKRVAVAGVLAMGPKVLVVDEPMNYLDPEARAGMWAIFDTLRVQGKAVVVATHDVDLASEWADRVVLMKGGKVLAQGSPELLVDPELVTEARLRFPTVAQLFLRLSDLGLEAPPATIREALRAIRWIQAGLL